MRMCDAQAYAHVTASSLQPCQKPGMPIVFGCMSPTLIGVINTACHSMLQSITTRCRTAWSSAVLEFPMTCSYSTNTLLEHNIPGECLASLHIANPKAVFVKSSVQLDQMPAPIKPEIALIGHSNVGKSSLINLLTGQQDLAKVSKQPGKTKCINHFLINSKFYLVDCPGYGYARVSKKDRLMWHDVTQQYMLQRESLAHVMLLVDAMQAPNKLDIDAAVWLHQQHVPHTLVFTKVDLQTCSLGDPEDPVKQSSVRTASHTVDTFTDALRQIRFHLDKALRSSQHKVPVRESAMYNAAEYPYYILTSSKTGLGRDVVLSYMLSISQSFDVPITFR